MIERIGENLYSDTLCIPIAGSNENEILKELFGCKMNDIISSRSLRGECFTLEARQTIFNDVTRYISVNLDNVAIRIKNIIYRYKDITNICIEVRFKLIMKDNTLVTSNLSQFRLETRALFNGDSFRLVTFDLIMCSSDMVRG